MSKVFIFIENGIIQGIWSSDLQTEIKVVNRDILKKTNNEEVRAHLEANQKEFKTAQNNNEIFLVY